MLNSPSQSSKPIVDEIDRGRAREYALLASLLSRSPDSPLLSLLATVRGDACACRKLNPSVLVVESA
jgi:hypothetical protein